MNKPSVILVKEKEMGQHDHVIAVCSDDEQATTVIHNYLATKYPMTERMNIWELEEIDKERQHFFDTCMVIEKVFLNTLIERK